MATSKRIQGLASRGIEWMWTHRWSFVVASIVLTLLFGTVGYMVVGQDVGFLDGVYMAVLTATGTGYENLVNTDGGKAFSILFMIVGAVVASTAISILAATFIEGSLRDVMGRRLMGRRIQELEGHIILCGFGRFGQLTADELAGGSVPFVVVDTDVAQVEAAERHGFLAMQADATEEESLELAGIAKARALLLSLPSDAQNVYTILNAREIRTDRDQFCIVALARDRSAERKLMRAGATHVVSPYTIGSRHMARQVLAPNLATVMSLATESDGGLEQVGVSMRELEIAEGSPLAGQMLKDAPIRREYDAIVVAVIEGSSPRFNPGPNHVIRAGEVLIVVGPSEGLQRLQETSAGGS